MHSHLMIRKHRRNISHTRSSASSRSNISTQHRVCSVQEAADVIFTCIAVLIAVQPRSSPHTIKHAQHTWLTTSKIEWLIWNAGVLAFSSRRKIHTNSVKMLCSQARALIIHHNFGRVHNSVPLHSHASHPLLRGAVWAVRRVQPQDMRQAEGCICLDVLQQHTEVKEWYMAQQYALHASRCCTFHLVLVVRQRLLDQGRCNVCTGDPLAVGRL
jgi:hypothetical protein